MQASLAPWRREGAVAECCVGAWLQVRKTAGGDAALTSPWLTCVHLLLGSALQPVQGEVPLPGALPVP